MKVCPHCKRAFPPKLVVGGVYRQRMLDFIAAHPEGVTTWQIMGAMYSDDPDGGTDCRNIVSVMARQINKILKGYRVRSPMGHGAVYTLRKLP